MTTTRGEQAPAIASAAAPEPSLVQPAEIPDVPQPAAPQPVAPQAEALQAAVPERATVLPPQLAKILGGIVAPTTLLTALLYYFGWSHAYWFFNYFGVNSTVLGFTGTDYMMRSVDALFVPMMVGASAVLLAVWGHSLLRGRLAAGFRPRAFRFIVLAMAIAGGILAFGGFASVFTTTVLSDHLVAAPLSLGLGVLLLVYAFALRRLVTEKYESTSGGRGWAGLVEWAVVFVLVGLSLFWAATDYSAAVGRSRAIDFVATMPSYPSVVIYSDRSLSLEAPGVRETRCKDSQAAYRFRYDGLKLVLESGDQYLFLPAAWTPAGGVAILLPRSTALRLEFFPARTEPGHGSPGC